MPTRIYYYYVTIDSDDMADMLPDLALTGIPSSASKQLTALHGLLAGGCTPWIAAPPDKNRPGRMQTSHSHRLQELDIGSLPLSLVLSGRFRGPPSHHFSCLLVLATKRDSNAWPKQKTWKPSASDKPKHREAPRKCLLSRVTQPIIG